MEMEEKRMVVEEKNAKTKSGIGMLCIISLGFIAAVGLIIGGALITAQYQAGTVHFTIGVIAIILGSLAVCILPVLSAGLKAVNPNEALVLVLFGNYYGTIRKEGFYWVNPFCSAVNPTVKVMANGESKKVSLKTSTLNNEKQKVNDEMGNPIEIGVIVIWKVTDPTKAVFNVNNFKTYLSTQCDAVIRNVARCYPYDKNEVGDEWSLRGSSQEIADVMQNELQKKVQNAGIAIDDVRIAHLSYAPEIASAMLQRQQAAAIIDARQKIVEGAVGMVEMALAKLNENEVVNLDEERKAAMVSNLLVVLCGNKDAQPIVNSGTIY